jgi:hypothetical protein
MLKRLFDYCQGRHTFFTIAFFISGNAMHWFHRLDGTYIGYMTALMTFIFGHAVQENMFAKKEEAGKDGGDKGASNVGK